MKPHNIAEKLPGDYFHAGLILVAFALFAIGTLVHYPIFLMMLLGMAFVWKKYDRECPVPINTILIMYLSIWLPMLIATADAVNLARTLKTTLLYLHFFPVLVYLVIAGRRERVRRLVAYGLVMLLLFATIDALLQLTLGQNLFGYPYSHGLLTGVFHPKQRIGLFASALVPLVLHIGQSQKIGKNTQLVMVTLLFIVILLSLKRSAWLMGMVAVIGYFWICGKKTERPSLKSTLLVLIVLAFAGAASLFFSDPLQRQIKNSFVTPFSEISQIDHASSHRLSLWQTGLRIFSDHWINGIGPRGYRDVYRDYANTEDFWMKRGGGGQTHPHWLLLEVGVEAGILGLLGLALFYVGIYRLLNCHRLDSSGRVFVLCAAVAWFPLNMHMAFYGSYWATFVWLLFGFGVAGYRPQAKKV